MGQSPPAAIDTKIRACLDKGGHQQALELLACTYLDTVFRYCFQMLNEDTTRARDVTQQVFEEACKGIVRFRGDASAKTWLLAIAHNQCLKEIDTRRRQRTLLHDNQAHVVTQAHADPQPLAESAMLSQEGLTRLRQALERLEPEARSLLIMRFGVGVSSELSTTEMAQVLGISRASTYRKLHQALTRMRRIMDHDLG